MNEETMRAPPSRYLTLLVIMLGGLLCKCSPKEDEVHQHGHPVAEPAHTVASTKASISSDRIQYIGTLHYSGANFVPLEKECVGSKIGSTEITCKNLNSDPEIQGWMKTIERAIDRVLMLQRISIDVQIEIGISLIGLADSNPYTKEGPQATAMHQDRDRLKNLVGVPTPADLSLNRELSCVRALRIGEQLINSINNLNAQLNDRGVNKSRLQVGLDCREMPIAGPQYRGAKLEAWVLVSVPPEYSDITEKKLSESGWEVQSLVSVQE